MKKIAVVILNWNGVELLRQFLPSVLQFSTEATIYVIDNASTDVSVSVLKSEFPTVQIIENEGNFGFAKGYNEGLKTIKEPYLALVNSDIEVTKNWLQPILNQFEKDTLTAIIQPKILDFKNKSYFEYAGAAGGFIDKYGYPYCRGRIFDKIEEDKGQYDSTINIFWASGACFFIRNQVFQELQGFDEGFFAHQEEIDLCWRAHHMGYEIKFCYQSVVYHVGGATLNNESPRKTYLNFRNSLYMLTKNLPKNTLVPILFSRLLLDGIAAFRFLTQGKFKHLIAILRAHFHFYSNFKDYYNKRNSQNIRKYYTISSIVNRFFIQKQQTYTKLF
ncbi:MAG: dTDP-Rha--alpha-D-GlcNAc-pyrophosphate polyprenol alpha-3-L-rhamnosyltransferase [Flavobacterium sp.]|uniref:glycosyltransferase family 2 protein n=1 Tax=Flavobacterium sp. TaxID=239 RepID=UPI000C59F108|nr:glycosyltransferase family 2 protein [Flavobacterium sp.]MBF02953.1 dTDP-Rha--alpha-D-GlcNAc-pyrophosphate polyprenol alpha-3-L-rhamnosyltransferase [Flavobacterium sp.]